MSSFFCKIYVIDSRLNFRSYKCKRYYAIDVKSPQFATYFVNYDNLRRIATFACFSPLYKQASKTSIIKCSCVDTLPSNTPAPTDIDFSCR